MSNRDWRATAELIGIAAIVASLIFVGLQMKQSQEIAVADQYQARADAALEFYLALMQDENSLTMRGKIIVDDVAAGRSPDAIKNALESEGPQMLASRYLVYRANITMFDNYHFQYQQGFLSEEAWLAFRVRLKGLFSNEVGAAFYAGQADDFRQSFQDVCSQILAELATETAK